MAARASRILVVEDEAIIAMELANALHDFGYKVVGTAADSEQAIDLAERARPDLVMMDIGLRGAADGIETACRLRARREVPVVFLTAFGDAGTLERSKQAAPYGYLLKPYRAEELRATVETALARHALHAGMLQAAREELDQLSYSVSHNLRTPLRAINSFASLLAAEDTSRLDEEARALLTRLGESAVHMGALVDGLLGFMAVSRHVLQPRTVEPGALVRGVLDERRAALEALGVEVSVGALPSCTADTVLLRSVFEQLIGNALKFSTRSVPPRIKIGGRRDGGELVYFVRDNGAGFDMRFYGKLFGLYESLHSPGEFEGAGVGLALARRIIERHGGRIWAEARPGEGASFFFTLGGAEPLP